MVTTGTTASETSLLEYLSHGSATDVGRKRSENQDSIGIIESSHYKIYIVADGMGGVQGGAVASQLAIETFKVNILSQQLISEALLAQGVQEANKAIYEKGQSNQELAGMGTTFAALAFTKNLLYVMHVGDSRAYRYRSSRLERLTHDHTLIQELVDAGALSESQAENSPVSHMLTRSLGPVDDVKPDCWKMFDGPVAGDRYLICSDGLYNLVNDDEVGQIMSLHSTDEECCRALVNEANQRGGTDNISVVLVTVDNNYPFTFQDLPESIRLASQSEDTQELSRSQLNQTQTELRDAALKNGDLNRNNLRQSPELGPQVDISSAFNNISSNNKEDNNLEDLDSIQHDQINGISSLKYKARRFLPIVLGIAVGIVIVFNFLSSNQEYNTEINNAAITEKNNDNKQLIADNTANITDNKINDEKNISDNNIEEETPLVLSVKEIYADSEERKANLKERISIVNNFLNVLKGVEGSSIPNLASFKERIEKSETLLAESTKQIDIATRKLSVWHGRRRRLDTTDALSMSIEVATASDRVKEAKQAFDKVTWQYLKKVELLRYEPDGAEKQTNLAKLRQEREAELAQLARAVRIAVQEEIQATDKEIADLTLKKQEAEGQLANLKYQRRIVKIINSNEDQAKSETRDELERELEKLQEEYDLLTPLVDADSQ